MAKYLVTEKCYLILTRTAVVESEVEDFVSEDFRAAVNSGEVEEVWEDAYPNGMSSEFDYELVEN